MSQMIHNLDFAIAICDQEEDGDCSCSASWLLGHTCMDVHLKEKLRHHYPKSCVDTCDRQTDIKIKR